MPLGLKLPKSDAEVLKLSPSETWILMLATGGWYGFRWCACVMRATNSQLNRQVFDVDRIRSNLVLSFAGVFLLMPLDMVVILLFPTAGLVVFYLLYAATLMFLLVVPMRVMYQIASRIREMQIVQGRSELLRPWFAVLLVILCYFGFYYLQWHVKTLELEHA